MSIPVGSDKKRHAHSILNRTSLCVVRSVCLFVCSNKERAINLKGIPLFSHAITVFSFFISLHEITTFWLRDEITISDNVTRYPFWKCMLVKLPSLWCKRDPRCENGWKNLSPFLPSAHQSTALLWPLDWMISGARYSGVPHKVQVLQVQQTADRRNENKKKKKKKREKGIFMVNVERPVYNLKRALASCACTTARSLLSNDLPMLPFVPHSL